METTDLVRDALGAWSARRTKLAENSSEKDLDVPHARYLVDLVEKIRREEDPVILKAYESPVNRYVFGWESDAPVLVLASEALGIASLQAAAKQMHRSFHRQASMSMLPDTMSDRGRELNVAISVVTSSVDSLALSAVLGQMEPLPDADELLAPFKGVPLPL